MKAKAIIAAALGALLITLSITVHAQQPTKIPRVAFLGTASASIVADRIDALRKGLRELGVLGRQNIVLQYRFAEGKSKEINN